MLPGKRSQKVMPTLDIKAQVQRLLNIGYSSALISAVAEKHLKQLKNPGGRSQPQSAPVRMKRVAVAYMHNVSHRLKNKIGKSAGVTVVLSAPEKLAKLCKLANNPAAIRGRCTVKHRT